MNKYVNILYGLILGFFLSLFIYTLLNQWVWLSMRFTLAYLLPIGLLIGLGIGYKTHKKSIKAIICLEIITLLTIIIFYGISHILPYIATFIKEGLFMPFTINQLFIPVGILMLTINGFFIFIGIKTHEVN